VAPSPPSRLRHTLLHRPLPPQWTSHFAAAPRSLTPPFASQGCLPPPPRLRPCLPPPRRLPLSHNTYLPPSPRHCATRVQRAWRAGGAPARGRHRPRAVVARVRRLLLLVVCAQCAREHHHAGQQPLPGRDGRVGRLRGASRRTLPSHAGAWEGERGERERERRERERPCVASIMRHAGASRAAVKQPACWQHLPPPCAVQYCVPPRAASRLGAALHHTPPLAHSSSAPSPGSWDAGCGLQVWDTSGAGHVLYEAEDAGAAVLGHVVENHVLQGALHRLLTVRHPLRVSAVGRLLEGG
jgi:hypothetical protein